jgi:leader peptidase (prepilin peptidase)/N-methyltransferase
MIRILGTIFAGLLGLAFGSFLNVCLSRWPEGESVVHPRSHCRNCDHTLSWWENIPVLSWLALRARCRNCRKPISWRYPMVEIALGALWAFFVWSSMPAVPDSGIPVTVVVFALATGIAQMILSWILLALAVLDAEHFWLPNALTIPGILLGFALTAAREHFGYHFDTPPRTLRALVGSILAAGAAALLILLIRWLYQLIRHREGIGLGDAKLIALLAAWLGLPGALLAFALGTILGSLAAIVLLAVPAARRNSDSWAATKLPFGTFLCVGGIVSSFWGQPMINAYLRWAGF